MPEEYKIRRSKTMKEKRAIHPEFWDGQVESLYKRWEDPIEKEKQSQRSKELWKNPDYRNHRTSSITVPFFVICING